LVWKLLFSSEEIPSSKFSFDSSNNESAKDSVNNEYSKDFSPAQDTLEDRRVLVFVNPLFDNNNDYSNLLSTQHQRPKWSQQLLKDVHPNEMKKIGTGISLKTKSNFALLAHASTQPTTFGEAVEHKEW